MKKKDTHTLPSLTHETTIKVRFSEVDSMGVVWHGEYIKYFEDGREAFGHHFQLDYLDVYNHGFVIPIVDVNCQYKHSLTVGDTATIETQYINTQAAKIIFQYNIYKEPEHLLAATGCTTQVFVNKQTGEMEYEIPAFYLEWKQKWIK